MNLNGMVYDFENKPIAGYELTIGKSNVSSDITGRFALQNISLGKYDIYGKKEGYETYLGVIAVQDNKQIVYIRVPSQAQLLDLADKALMENKLDVADNYITRANSTGVVSTESALYSAVVHFRKNDLIGAQNILDGLISTGVTDLYVRKFREDLERRMAK
jgi:hypothetical protein